MKERLRLSVQARAAQQGGRIAWWQLNAAGVPKSLAQSWIAAGWLIPTLPRVYAVGVALDNEPAKYWDAVLYAGPLAMLSHGSAGFHTGLLRYPPWGGVVQVSTPRRVESRPLLIVHSRRTVDRLVGADGIPTTSLPQTAVDIASLGQLPLLRRALSELDYRREYDPAKIAAMCGSGVPGTRLIAEAIAKHTLEYRKLNDGPETEFFELCERGGIPLPEINVELEPGLIPDALWRDQCVVAEIDDDGNHSTSAQRLRDAQRDMRYRQLGLTPLRYRVAQIRHEPEAVVADLRSELAHIPLRKIST